MACTLPTCSIKYRRDLHTQVKRRDGSDAWGTKERGYGNASYKWLGKTCVKRHNLQGYNEKGSGMVCCDTNKIIGFGSL